MAVIGLDVGTAGCKATVVHEDGTVLASAYRPYSLSAPGPGMAELDPNVVWRSVCAVLAEAARGQDVRAIAIASLGESFVCLDENDAVLAPALLYSDVRGADEAEEIKSAIPLEELFAITGMPLNPMYTLCKLLWARKHADYLNRARRIMLFGDYIGYMLTGEAAIDYSLASRTLMFDVRGKRWADRILNRFDIDAGLLSSPVQSGTAVGRLRRSVAGELGIPPYVTLYAGAHDQVCAALGAGVLNAGDCVDGMGTSECITAVLSEQPDVRRMLSNNFCLEPYAAGGYITLAFNPAAGAAVNWYRDTIERERSAACAADGRDIFAEMESECPDGPTPLLFLPHLAGAGTPHMDPFSRGMLAGLSLSTTRGELYKAFLEGICFEIRLNAELLADLGSNIQKLICAGGLSRSDILMQIKADIMGIPVTRLAQKESGTMGLAMLCLTAEGVYADYAQAARTMVKTDRTFEPDPSKVQVYAEKYRAYSRMYWAAKEMMKGERHVADHIEG